MLWMALCNVARGRQVGIAYLRGIVAERKAGQFKRRSPSQTHQTRNRVMSHTG